MSNLTSTQPGAFDAFLSLLTSAGAAQNPAVPVFDSEILTYEPGSYILLKGFDGHHRFFNPDLGSFAFYEEYTLCGCATYLQGNIDPKTVRDTTFSLYQNVVMTTVIQNSGRIGSNPVLGSSAPAALEWIIPSSANYWQAPGNFGGEEQGIMGAIDFEFTVQARITTA